MTEAPPSLTNASHSTDGLDLTASLSRLETALDRIAEASVAASMAAETRRDDAAMDSALSANMAARLDGMIGRLRAAIENTEESTAWPRSM